ncbi:hypothetical protein MP638_005546 [Amoeboaphelidium occidentale]|nr:hypothetical protein MP638_005546 [Amoeboaphelidium occidentale]
MVCLNTIPPISRRPSFLVNMRKKYTLFVRIFILLVLILGFSFMMHLGRDLDEISGAIAVETSLFADTQPKRSTLGFDKIFVVYLPHRMDRYNHVQVMADYHNLEVEFIPGETPQSESVMKYLARKEFEGNDDINDEHNKRIMSCYFSHRLIYERMQKENIESVLILEDDVDFEVSLVPEWTKMYNVTRNLPWDMLFPGHCFAGGMKPYVGRLSVAESAMCTHAYAITKTFAKKFLDKYDFVNLYSIDVLLNAFCQDEKCYRFLAEPPLVIQMPMSKTNPSEVLNTLDQGQRLSNSTSQLLGLTL